MVALLFTDLVGSTEMLDRLGDDAAEELRRTHFSSLRRAVAQSGGREVKSLGDGLMVSFASSVQAVGCAMAIQQAIAEHNRAQPRQPLQVRVGLHAGEPLWEDDDCHGTAVVVAKRLCDQARGGQILASELVAGLVGKRGAFRFRPVGRLSLKGLAEPVATMALDWEPVQPSDGEYRVLGPIEVVGEAGTPVPLASARQRLLLALLLARPGQVVSADELVDGLWGAHPPADPRAALQSHVSRLRQRLGPSAPLETTPTGYSLGASDRVDATRFERLISEARRLPGDPEAALARWDAALTLWRGRAFLDVADHPGIQPNAIRLEGLRVEAAEARVETLLALGRVTDAVVAAETLAVEEPFRERPVELRMRALAAGGRYVEALRVYDTFRRTLADEIGLDPSPELRALEGEILRHERPAPTSPVPRAPAAVVRPATLVPPPDAFLGRDTEMATLGDLLGRTRLVTITGPGGVGKTRLALHVLEAVADRYPDGIWCCDLASVGAGQPVADVVASTLRLDRRAGTTTEERIVEFLAAKRALLLLDNCEHVLDGVAALVEAVLPGTTGVQVLTTSREPLTVPGERRYPLDPLPVPDQAEAATPAVALFADRANAANPRFHLDEENLPAVCELCRQLDGLPLAIELAAARVAARTVSEIAAEVGERLGELPGGRRRVARHRSIHALVEWSYELLAPSDQRLFEQLAVFAGGCTAAAAAAIAPDGDPALVVDQLSRLVDQSLVVTRPQRDTTRYVLLESIRAYAEHRLRQRGAHADTRARHAGWFVTLAEEADAGLRGPDEPRWVARLDQELANLRAAHEGLLARGDADGALRLSAALFWYGYGGNQAEVFAWAEQAAERFAGVDHPAMAAVCAHAAVGAWRRADLPRCRALAERGLEAARSDPATGRLALGALGDVEMFSGAFDTALVHHEAAAELGRTVGDDLQVAVDVGSCALALACAGDAERARELADDLLAGAATGRNPTTLAWAYYFAAEVRLETAPAEAAPLLDRSLAEAGRVPNRFLLGVARLSAVSIQARSGDPAAALARYPDLLEHWNRAGAWNQQWFTIRTLIEALARTGQNEAAAVLHGALCTSPTATPLAGPDAARLAAVVDRLRGDLGPERLEALRARGASLGDAGAVSYAIEILRDLVQPT
jgi:predicted ATPase/class 3 adenylate cyclase